MTSTPMVVSVERLVPVDQLASDDKTDDCQCAIEGEYLVEVCHSLRWKDGSAKDHPDEVALEIFQNRVPIEVPEHYDVTVGPLEHGQDTELMEGIH